MPKRKKQEGAINTDGGSHISGDVTAHNGDVIGRDKITNINIYNNLPADAATTPTYSERLEKLEESKAWSKARCEQRWIALGVSNAKIPLFLENPIFDRTDRVISFDETHPLKILIGDFGVGKSLLAEMLFQKLVDNAINDRESPIPIFITSNELTESFNLFKNIQKASELIGDWRKFGVRVIVDGADEISSIQVGELLKQAITITKANSKISIIITGRPISDFENAYFKKFTVPELSIPEIIAIIETVSGHREHKHFFYEQPIAIIDALKKPFFAILYGVYKQQLNKGIIKSKGELISYLVETAVNAVEDSETIGLLQTLAVLVVKREGIYIPISDVGSTEQIRLLLKCRLVIKKDNAIGFALPIFAQWFAAKAIENDKISLNELTANIHQIKKWYYPLIILASNASFEKVSQVLIPIAEKNPSILAEIIKASTTNNYGRSEILDIGLPTAREMGERIVLASQALHNGLGLIANDFAPIAGAKKLASIGICKNKENFLIIWYDDHKGEQIVELPEDFDIKFHRGKSTWYPNISISPGLQGVWVWELLLDMLKERMKEVIEKKTYFLPNGYIFKERMWETARNIMRHGGFSHRPIPIKDIRKRIEIESGFRIPKDIFLTYLNSLEENGEENISPLWPGSNKILQEARGSAIWSSYTPERLVERANLIYSAAIEEYVNLVNYFFSPFAERLTTYATLPAKFVLYMIEDNEDWQLMSYFDPLHFGEKSLVDIEITNRNQIKLNTSISDAIYKNLREMRPNLVKYYGIHNSGFYGGFFEGSPVTNLVYRWLADDLKDISWIN